MTRQTLLWSCVLMAVVVGAATPLFRDIADWRLHLLGRVALAITAFLVSLVVVRAVERRRERQRRL